MLATHRQTLTQWYLACTPPCSQEQAQEAAGGQRTVSHANQQLGIRWAACGARCAVAYVQGGWSAHVWVDGMGWCLSEAAQDEDASAWRPLLAALGLADE